MHRHHRQSLAAQGVHLRNATCEKWRQLRQEATHTLILPDVAVLLSSSRSYRLAVAQHMLARLRCISEHQQRQRTSVKKNWACRSIQKFVFCLHAAKSRACHNSQGLWVRTSEPCNLGKDRRCPPVRGRCKPIPVLWNGALLSLVSLVSQTQTRLSVLSC